MAYADQIAAVKTHAVAAGAALTRAITDVAIAAPVPRGRCVRIFYGGEAEPVRMGTARVLTGELIAERIVVVIFLPIGEYAETLTSAIEDDLYAFKHELRTRIQADSQLGGQSTDLEIGYAATEFLQIGQVVYRTLEMEITTDYIEYPIAP